MDSSTGKAIIKALLSLGISLLGKFIPFLATLTGMPVIGWIIGLGVSYLSGVLYKMIETWARYNAIDNAVSKEVTEAQKKTEELKIIQNDPTATEADRAKKLEEFRLAVRNLTKYRVRKG